MALPHGAVSWSAKRVVVFPDHTFLLYVYQCLDNGKIYKYAKCDQNTRAIQI